MAKTVTEDLQVQALLEQIAESGFQVTQGGEMKVDPLPTGIASFDHSTGIGGFPRGRIVIVQGEEGSGKTLLALTTIARTQLDGGRAAFIDLEHALTPSFAELLGVDYSKLYLNRPKTLNDAYDVARALADSALFDIIVFDSAVALSTKDAIGKSASDGSQRATEAQVHSQELKKMTAVVENGRTVFMIINQMRENPNPPVWARGKQLYTPGGRGLKHASSMTVEVSIGERYEKAGKRIGQRTKTYIVKNKVAQPFTRSEFDLMYVGGLDLTTSFIDTALEYGIIRRSGSTYYFDLYDLSTAEVVEEFKWAGRAKMVDAINADDRIKEAIAEYLKQADPEAGEVAE